MHTCRLVRGVKLLAWSFGASQALYLVMPTCILPGKLWTADTCQQEKLSQLAQKVGQSFYNSSVWPPASTITVKLAEATTCIPRTAFSCTASQVYTESALRIATTCLQRPCLFAPRGGRFGEVLLYIIVIFSLPLQALYSVWSCYSAITTKSKIFAPLFLYDPVGWLLQFFTGRKIMY